MRSPVMNTIFKIYFLKSLLMYQNFRHFVIHTIRTNSLNVSVSFFQGLGKDFDLYYYPLLLAQMAGAIMYLKSLLADLLLPVTLAESNSCNPVVTVLIHSALGTCLLQIAMNWLEVAGMYNTKQQKR